MAKKGFFSGFGGQSYDDYVRDQEAERDYSFAEKPEPEEESEKVVRGECGAEVGTADPQEENVTDVSGAVGLFMVLFGLGFIMMATLFGIVSAMVGDIVFLLVSMVFMVVGIFIFVSGIITRVKRGETSDDNTVYITWKKE